MDDGDVSCTGAARAWEGWEGVEGVAESSDQVADQGNYTRMLGVVKLATARTSPVIII
jgi:hypothetical protein